MSWRDILSFPLGDRLPKPRNQGLTMVIDKGLGLIETKDILHINGGFIDIYKLGFGTSALYIPEILREKIYLVRSLDIDIYPGGTFLEVAILQNKLEEYLHMAKELGFNAIEVSDGTITMSDELREKAITWAVEMGFKVFSEVGKKENNGQEDVQSLVDQVLSDLQLGAHKVILEGRESGIGVGLYDDSGRFIQEDMDRLLEGISDPRVILWEAPQKDQQQELITRFGPNVNLGNIPPGEVMAVEALRVGLRADTLKNVCGQVTPKR